MDQISNLQNRLEPSPSRVRASYQIISFTAPIPAALSFEHRVSQPASFISGTRTAVTGTNHKDRSLSVANHRVSMQRALAALFRLRCAACSLGLPLVDGGALKPPGGVALRAQVAWSNTPIGVHALTSGCVRTTRGKGAGSGRHRASHFTLTG
jgi:hypothetical protein